MKHMMCSPIHEKSGTPRIPDTSKQMYMMQALIQTYHEHNVMMHTKCSQFFSSTEAHELRCSHEFEHSVKDQPLC